MRFPATGGLSREVIRMNAARFCEEMREAKTAQAEATEVRAHATDDLPLADNVIPFPIEYGRR